MRFEIVPPPHNNLMSFARAITPFRAAFNIGGRKSRSSTTRISLGRTCLIDRPRRCANLASNIIPRHRELQSEASHRFRYFRRSAPPAANFFPYFLSHFLVFPRISEFQDSLLVLSHLDTHCRFLQCRLYGTFQSTCITCIISNLINVSGEKGREKLSCFF